jgi:phosphoribosylanthranilate isomerase
VERLRLKVCGMRNPEEATQVARLGVDYLGFIFYPESPRYVGEEFTFDGGAAVQTVGVFVNDNRTSMIKSLKRIGSRMVQLHGDEQPAECQALRDLGYTVIKAIRIGEDIDFSQLKNYQNVIDYFLFDTKGKLYGGNASKFDWKILKGYNQQTPFFLSGGIKPEHIQDICALRDMNLHGVDVNSGVESSPGVKDLSKVRETKTIVDKI